MNENFIKKTIYCRWNCTNSSDNSDICISSNQFEKSLDNILSYFSILPHLRMVELNQEGGSVSWFGVKRNFKWKELEVITYGDIGVVRGERWEGIFFSNKALTPKGKRMTTIERIYFSLNIFEQFFVIFNDEKEKEQIMNLLKEWDVNVTTDRDFAQRKEHERILEEKTKMREERKRLYEESKKRKR